MRLDIIGNEEKKMKVIQVGQTKYYAQDKQDLISIAHELAQKGFTIQQIAQALGISERTARKYMSECW